LNTPVGDVTFRVLGPLEADGVPALGGPKQRAVVGVLLLEQGRVVSAESIVRYVRGPDAGPSSVRTLHAYVSRLRAILGDAVESRGWGYAIHAEVDARRFEALAASGQHTAALALWRGPVLADLPGLWTHPEAVRLEELRLQTVERAGDPAQLEALLEEDPYRESAWEALMLSLHRAGRSADALEAFRRARVALDERGLEPGPRLADLQRRILRHEVPMATNVPAAVEPLIGRDEELGEIEALLREARLVTVTGIGGGGKTRLALEVARRALVERPAWVVELASLSDPAGVADSIARALGATNDVAPLEAAAARIGTSDALLVVDNAEHLIEATGAAVLSLLGAAPGLRVLVTSRRPLGVAGECAYVLPALGAEAVALFRTRAAIPLTADDMDDVAAICAAVDGIPLGVEIAAARTRMLSVREIRQALAEGDALAWPGGAQPQRHRSLRSALEWSYALLSPGDRDVLARLGAFAGSFTLAAAADVAALADPVAGLAPLVDASLLVVEHGTETRYRLLDTIRAYARSVADASDARRAHARHYLAIAERAYAAAFAPGEDVLLQQLEREHNELRAALTWALLDGGDRGVGLRLARALTWFWGTLGHAVEGRAWLDLALSDEVPDDLRGSLTGARAFVAFRLADYDEARPFFEHAAATDGGGRWLHYLAACWLHAGDHSGALAIAARALELERAAGDDAGIAWTLGLLADTALNDGDTDRAAELYAKGQPYVEAAGNPPRLVLGYAASLAELALSRGELDLAELRGEEALLLAEQLGERWHIAVCRITLARAAAARGDVARALELATAARREAVEIGDRRVEAEAQAVLDSDAANAWHHDAP
jgi:predicted ATPase/DNA-binding SARP family transcriptional activator